MSSSGIGPDQDPLKPYYRIEEIERIRWEEEKKDRGGPPREPPEPKPGFAAFIMLLLEKVMVFIKVSIQKGLAAASTKPLREDLLLIKASFETMMREDRSQDAPFLKHLSKLWQNVLEHSIRLQPKSSWDKGIKALIKDIESHPKDREHTFGYYLDEYAGQKWLPFPYIELIQELYRMHAMDPPSSLLSRWTGMIEEILNSE